MKKLLVPIALSISLLTGVAFAKGTGTIAQGAAPEHSAQARTANAALDDYYVNINNQDTAPVYITMYLNGTIAYGAPYQPVGFGMYHIGFDAPYTFLNMQAACYPNGPAIPNVGGNFGDGSTFTIPFGACSLSKKK